MKRLAFVVAPFLAFSGVALAQNAPANDAASPPAAAQPAMPQAQSQHHHRRHMAAARAAHNDQEAERITKALNLLEANGYGDFKNFQPDGQNYVADVMSGGQQMKVAVDPSSGQVTRAG